MIFIINYIEKTHYSTILFTMHRNAFGKTEWCTTCIHLLSKERRNQMGFCCCTDNGERLQICKSYMLCVHLSNEVDSRCLLFQTAFLLFYNDSGMIKEKETIYKRKPDIFALLDNEVGREMEICGVLCSSWAQLHKCHPSWECCSGYYSCFLHYVEP